jgi:hypothetical protein
MMRNTIDPGPHRAAAIVELKTPPQLQMNVLAQVTAFLRISLVGRREPLESRAEFLRRVVVQLVLARSPCGNRLISSHTQGSRSEQKFLTPGRENIYVQHVALNGVYS